MRAGGPPRPAPPPTTTTPNHDHPQPPPPATPTPPPPPLPAGEYGGPRLPLDLLQHGEYALEVTGARSFVDGHWDNSPIHNPSAAAGGARGGGRPLYPAIFVNHSRRSPNARFEKLGVGRRDEMQLKERMMLVALEPIEPGAE